MKRVQRDQGHYSPSTFRQGSDRVQSIQHLRISLSSVSTEPPGPAIARLVQETYLDRHISLSAGILTNKGRFASAGSINSSNATTLSACRTSFLPIWSSTRDCRSPTGMLNESMTAVLDLALTSRCIQISLSVEAPS